MYVHIMQNNIFRDYLEVDTIYGIIFQVTSRSFFVDFTLNYRMNTTDKIKKYKF